MPDELEQRERSRHAVDQRDRVVAEGRLQRGVLVELVEYDLRDRLALQLDLDAHPGAVGVIGQIGDLVQDLVVRELGDLLDDAGVAALLHSVRKLGDDDRGLSSAQLLDVSAGAHDDPAAAGPVRLPDALAPEDDPSGRKVRALYVLAQPLDVDLRVVDHRDDPVDHLAEVVGRDVRRHPDRDPGGAVDKQVREARRQDRGLAPPLVVVRDEVDGVGVDVAQELGRDPREPRFRVAHRCGRIVVDISKVALRSMSG